MEGEGGESVRGLMGEMGGGWRLWARREAWKWVMVF